MHASDLGALLIVLGNVLFEIFKTMGGLVTRPEAVLNEMVVLILAAAKAIGEKQSPITQLTIGQIKGSGKSPKLKKKASVARKTLFCVRHILKEYFKPSGEREELRFHLIDNYCKMYEKLEAWTDGNNLGSEVAAHGRRMLLLFSELSCATPPNEHLVFWRPVPKMHQMQHCLESQVAVAGNPRDCWCYLDESTIGDLVGVAESCHHSFVHRACIAKARIHG